MIHVARVAAEVWHTTSTVSTLDHPCSFALVPHQPSDEVRIAYISLGTQIEAFGAASFEGAGLGVGERAIERDEVISRLLDGHVGVVVAPASDEPDDDRLPDGFLAARDELRLREVTSRQAMMQIGLDLMSDPRGADPALFDVVASQWASDVAILVDVAMSLTAGADRQRYVDAHYHAQIQIARRVGLRQLAIRSIHSNPLLTI